MLFFCFFFVKGGALLFISGILPHILSLFTRFYLTPVYKPYAGYLTIIPWTRVGYEMIDSQRGAELAIIISYPTSASGIIVLLKTPLRWLPRVLLRLDSARYHCLPNVRIIARSKMTQVTLSRNEITSVFERREITSV